MSAAEPNHQTHAVEQQQQQQQQQQHSDWPSDEEKATTSIANDDLIAKSDHEKSGPPSQDAPSQQQPLPSAPQGPPGGPPPNGGALAWLQVLGSWMLFFNTWGILNTFGVYQTYYESGQLYVESSSSISWIGAIQALLVLVVGAFVGPIYDRGYFRELLLVGGFLIVLGHMMLSLCGEFWQCLLAQGFVIGIGGGCLFVPSVAILPTYFSSKIGMAVGMAASGSSMGGIIYPIMFYRLIDQVGFGWTVRILGFTALATLLIPIVVMKQRVKPAKPRSLIDWTAFTDIPYITFTIGCLIGFVGLFVAFFYTSFYGEETGYTDTSLSFYLVPILNSGSVFGRTIPNILADKIGPTNVIVPGAACVGIVLLCMIAVKNAGGLIVEALLAGFFSGIFIALPPVLFVALTRDKSKVGARIGMGFGIISLGVLAGGPGGGGVLGNGTNVNWTGTWIYAGVTCLAASAIFGVVRVMTGGLKLKVKI